jgi:hypothetical protein
MSLFLESLQRSQAGLVAALAVSMISVGAIVWSVGSTDRVTYLGPDHGQEQTIAQVRLKTLPEGSNVIERGAIYKAMRAGCRYDLNYSPQFGRLVSDRQRTKYIRSAVLVDCPSS